MCLLSIGMIELEEVLKYKLSPVPLSFFDSNGEMRHSTSKAKLKNRLQIETSQWLQSKADVVIIDGCGKLWSISWPKNATLRDLAYQTYQYSTFLPAAEDMCVFLVFNIYFKYSIYSIPIYIRLPSTNKRDYYDIFIKQNSHDWYHIENILLIWWLQTTLRIDL